MRTAIFPNVLWLPCLVAGMTCAGLANAQATGTPKGGGPPLTSDKTEQPSSSAVNRPAGSMDTGKLVTKEGTAKSRIHTNRSAGTGTAGGLPKKTPYDGAERSGTSGKDAVNQRPAPK